MGYLNDLSRETNLYVKEVSSPGSLKSGFDALNRLEPFIFQDILNDATKWAVLDNLRHYNEYRGTFKWSPGKPYKYYLHKIAYRHWAEMRFFYNVPFIGYYFLAGRKISEEEKVGLLRPFCAVETANEYFYLKSFPELNIEDLKQSLWNTSSEYDRLRLTIAARLYDLETGKKVKSIRDLVPKYFPAEPINRETGRPYQWKKTGEFM